MSKKKEAPRLEVDWKRVAKRAFMLANNEEMGPSEYGLLCDLLEPVEAEPINIKDFIAYK